MIGNVSSSYAYDSFGLLEDITARFTGNAIFSVRYARDHLGRVDTLTEVVGTDTTVWNFEYDPSGRLISVVRDGSIERTYVYDRNGNPLRMAGASGVVNAVYDAQDRLVSYGSSAFEYTADGDLRLKVTGQDSTEYQYSARGELLSVRLSPDTLIEYLYDALGRRIAKRINSSTVRAWLYADHLAPVAELDGLGQVLSRFVFGERGNVPAYMLRNGCTYRFLPDHRGSVRLVVDVETGEVAQRLDYDAFGVGKLLRWW